MRIDPDKEYTISEISDITGYPCHVLRYYEKEFELDIPRNSANHRYYTYKEIETFNYIKSLQEKGFSNKQIKLILNSPEILINEESDEAAATSLIVNKESDSPVDNSVIEISTHIRDVLINEIKPRIIEKENSSIKAINDLKEEISELKNEIRSKERDILICENAKLKMRLKEKAYELAELKEKINREKNKRGFFKRIFSKK